MFGGHCFLDEFFGARYGPPGAMVQTRESAHSTHAARYPHLHAFVSIRAARGEKSR
jgi:hypothetical protein